MPEKAISSQFLAERCGYWVFATTLSNLIRKSIVEGVVGGSLLPNQECRTSNAEKYNSWLKPFLRVHFA
ncbi:hypothetical protein MTF66_27365 [Pseudoalteromonas sp. 2CM39R]|uniref:hypothetical protein n=1 Tax=Pseudoalteromonas sp. 2CM39R TaxID=2929856 RepID=UPI0020BF833D|nr:hypothetical protein [Pseudoalteromonas sp. 2CM39R]MCK8128761.1 hypothetical protein [Pseudoalteromonas sp. 2CM39R]